MPPATLNTIYKSIIQPHFDYCSPVWDNCSQGLLTKLQKLQNRAARVLTRSSYDTPSTEVLEKLSWKTIAQRQTETRCILMYKILNGLQPDYLRYQFVSRSDVTQVSTRNSSNTLALPAPRTNFLKRSLRYNGGKLWNSLEPDLRHAESLSTFKSLLRSNCTSSHA